ncbi:MAG: Tat pathway signal protein [Solirubrobacteraceae bacterium]
MLTRRGFLAGAGAVAAGGVAACGTTIGASSAAVPVVALGREPSGLPVRQHAWSAVLARDQFGNSVSPKFDRLLFFDVNGSPSPAHARMLEASLRTLERRYKWGPLGLLFTAGWGPSYFEKLLGVSSPIPYAKGLSDFEVPSIDDYHLCLHLACDDAERLSAVEAALLHGAPLPGASGSLRLTDALRWRETRTGFVGAGLPAVNQEVGGIPPGNPVPPTSPLFMGFKSGFVKNQATEDYVTIPDGTFAEGTTMQVSYMRLRLNSWYQDLNDKQRVARMYSPETTPEQVAQFTINAPPNSNLLDQAVNRDSVIGHSQTSGRARRNGKPLIIRRDFDTVDGGQAGLHFVSLQRTIADFVTTRTAMNASDVQLTNPAITDTVNNGINEFIFVLKRANYILPSRPQRSFPLLPGRRGATGLS